MSETARNYRRTLAKLFLARQSHDEQLEDELLSMLDKLWLGMSPKDRAQSETLGRKIAAGELNEDAFCFAELQPIVLGWGGSDESISIVQTSTVFERRSVVIRLGQTHSAKSTFPSALEMVA